jgi:hypothetical protein
MAYTNRILISKSKLNQKGEVFDAQTETCSKVLCDGEREDWTEEEIQLVKQLTLQSKQPAALIYVECFGGVCDHWAKVFDKGKEKVNFEEYPKLKDIMGCIDVDLKGEYYNFFSRIENPGMPRQIN